MERFSVLKALSTWACSRTGSSATSISARLAVEQTSTSLSQPRIGWSGRSSHGGERARVQTGTCPAPRLRSRRRRRRPPQPRGCDRSARAGPPSRTLSTPGRAWSRSRRSGPSPTTRGRCSQAPGPANARRASPASSTMGVRRAHRQSAVPRRPRARRPALASARSRLEHVACVRLLPPTPLPCLSPWSTPCRDLRSPASSVSETGKTCRSTRWAVESRKPRGQGAAGRLRSRPQARSGSATSQRQLAPRSHCLVRDRLAKVTRPG